MLPNRPGTLNKSILCLFFYFTLSFAHSQNPQLFSWANRAATLLNPQVYSGQSCSIVSQAVDSYGNIYIVGDFSSSAEFYRNGIMTSGTSGSTSLSDIYITKLAQNGIVMWKQKIGNAAIAESSVKISVYNNNVYVMGRFKNIPLGSLGTPVNDGILVLDPNGNYVSYIPTVNYTNSNVTMKGFEIHNNVIYLYGSFYSTVDFDISPAVASLAAANTSGFIQKISMTGAHLNVKKIGGTNELYFFDLKVVDDDIYAVGHFQGSANFNPNGSTVLSGSYAGFILHLDTAYNYQWAKVMDNTVTPGICQTRSIALDPLAESIYLVGNLDGAFNFDAGNTNLMLGLAGATRRFVAKFSTADGKLLWGNTYKTGATVEPRSVTVDNNTDVYITGRFGGYADFDINAGSTKLLSNGNDDVFVCKMDSSSNLLWVKQMGGIGSDYGTLVTLDPLNNLIVSGTFNNTGDFNPEPAGEFTLTGPGNYGFIGTFTVKMGSASTCSPTYGSFSQSICDGSSYLFNGINRTVAGAYKDTLANAAGCDSILTLNLSITNTVTASATITSDLGNSICTGNIITFSVTPVNGGSAPLYQWKRNGGNAGTGDTYAASNLLNGSQIYCVLTSTGTCATPSVVASNTITVAVNTSFTPSLSISSNAGTTICAGRLVTFLATTASSVTGASFQWTSNGANVGTGTTYTTNTLSNSDVIACILTTTAACATSTTASSNSITMTVNPSLTPAVTITPNLGSTICAGNTVTFTASSVNGGSAPIYQWKKNGANAGPTATYTVSSLANSDVISCILLSNATCASPTTVYSNSVTMTVNPLVTPSVSITSNSGTTICSGSLATFSANPVNGGVAPSYQWKKNGANIATGDTYTVSGLSNADVISCVMTSNASCASPLNVTSNSITITVTGSLTPVITISTPTVTICGSSAVFSSTITNGGSAPAYQWKKNGADVGSNITTYSPTNLVNGDVVSCVLTSNAACASPVTVSSNSVTMNVNTASTPSITITSNVGTSICTGSPVTFSASPVNGGSAPLYQWKKNGVNVGTTATYTVSSLINSDVISCVLTSNAACASPATATSNSLSITVNPLPLISVNSGTICSGRSFVIIPSGAVSYTYTGGSATVSPLVNSSYTVTGTDANGCTSASGAVSTVTVNALPTISVNSGAICAGNSFTVIPNGANTYTITGGAFNVSPTATTSYSVTGTNAQGCVSSNVAVSTVSVNALPTINVNSGAICAGASFSITPSGASTYTITGGSFNVSPTATTSYSITGTSVQGCVSSNVAVSTVSVNALPTISVNSGAICTGASFSITPSGATTYSITGGAFNVSPTATTSYSVTGTSAQGCVSSNVAVSTVSVNALPTISVNNGAICAGASFSITPSGATTYSITGGSFNVSPTATTAYSVTGTSAQGCVSSNVAVSTVSVKALPNISVNSGAICTGASFSITPSGASTYSITGGSFNVSPTATTSYSVTGTNAQGCVSSNVAVSTVSVNALPSISVNSGAICSGASFSITPSGATTYSITGGSFNVSPTATTAYSVTGTSAQGCASSNVAVSTVSVSALPTINVNSGAICSGASFSITASGASTYTITGGAFNVSPTTTTSYSVTGTNAQGCVSSNVAVSTVSVNALPTINVNSGAICAGASFSITPSGATTYSITGGAFNVSPTATTAYSVTGTSAQGCVSSNVTVSTVSVNALPTINVNSGAICAGASFSITASGATAYSITGGAFNVSPTATASYSVTGTSVEGCTSSNVAVSTVSVNALPTINVNSGVICSGTSFSITASGASTYTITGGAFNVSPTATSSYSVTGISAEGCTSSVAVSTVSVNALPTINVNSGVICSGTSFSVTANGASTYTITGGAFNVSPTATTSYSVTGTSAEGCTSSNAAVSTVSVNALPVINASTSNSIICVGEPVTLTANGGVSYVWNTGATNASITISPSATTDYTVTGTGSDGCSNTAIITQSVSLCTGIESLNTTKAFIEVYPNPTTGIITLKLSSDAQVIITNELGQQLFNQSLAHNEHSIDLSHVATGMYIVTVICKDHQQYFKLVKQ